MKLCKFCGHAMEWGREGDRWVGLVPIGADDNLDRTHQDENGHLRALHKAVCNYKAAVRVTRLVRPVPAHAIVPMNDPIVVGDGSRTDFVFEGGMPEGTYGNGY